MKPSQVTSDILTVIDDPSLAGRTHWTLTKLCGWLREEKQIELSYHTLVRYVCEHNYARRILCKIPEPPDRNVWIIQREASPWSWRELLEDPAKGVFFGDEAGFEGDPWSRAKWVIRSSRPTQCYYGGHIRQNGVGAVIQPPAGSSSGGIILRVQLAVLAHHTGAHRGVAAGGGGFPEALQLDASPGDHASRMISDFLHWGVLEQSSQTSTRGTSTSSNLEERYRTGGFSGTPATQ